MLKYNLLNEKFGEWTVVEYIDNGRWKCICNNGHTQIIAGHSLRNNITQYCKTCHIKPSPNFVDITGQRFNKLTVVEYLGSSKWKCLCDCGNISIIRGSHLKSGAVAKCRKCSDNLRRKTKKLIVCPKHGENGKCPDCKIESLTLNFIEKATKPHGNKYDYSKTIYKAQNTPIIIICPIHGEFNQTPKIHLKGHGCQQCGLEKAFKANEKRILSNNEFTENAQKVHGEKYEYNLVNYCNWKKKVCIICPVHGKFWQSPNDHTQGKGCPKCIATITKPHQMIIDMIPKNIEIITNDLSIIPPFEIDTWIPEYNLGIEIHGIAWHSLRLSTPYSSYSLLKTRHHRKTTAANHRSIKLLQFWDFEIINKSEIVKSMILHNLKQSRRIHARKCEIIEINNKIAAKFFYKTHLQGHRNASVSYALAIGSDIMGAISFSRHHKYGWEIIRYANSIGTTVVGGFSKILNHFIRTTEPKSILTFADRRFSNGSVYKLNGFNEKSITKPNYFYYKNHTCYSRQKCQKHKLPKLLGEKFDVKMSETENMLAAGYLQAFDAGHVKLSGDFCG